MPPAPPPVVLTVLFLFLTLLLTHPTPAFSNESPISAEYNCTANALPPTAPTSTPCLSRLLTDPELFSVCKTSICYIFVREQPFIIFDPRVFNSSDEALHLQRPFPCGDPTSLHPSLRGIAFETHKRTSSRDHYCVWAGSGDTCTFNEMVDITERFASLGYQLAITGLLLETPRRQCHHTASTALIQNSMIIIGERKASDSISAGPIQQLAKPFRGSTWGILAATLVLFVVVCFAIVFRFHFVRGRSLLTAFFIFTGARDEAMAYEASQRHRQRMQRTRRRIRLCNGNLQMVRVPRRSNVDGSACPSAQQQSKPFNEAGSMAFATKYGLAMALFRISVVAFLAIFALFYEVAVVNFLFLQQARQLGTSVRLLSALDLRLYSVLKNSALEQFWNATVNAGGFKYDGANESAIPWQRCQEGIECVQWTIDDTDIVKFDVTFEVVGTFLIKEASDCKTLTVFETEDLLYRFDGGWLYNAAVDNTTRRQIDRELLALRINGTIDELVDAEIGKFSCVEQPRTDIGPAIILIPCAIFVIPPLVGTVLVMLCWKDRRRELHVVGHASKQPDEYADDMESGSLDSVGSTGKVPAELMSSQHSTA